MTLFLRQSNSRGITNEQVGRGFVSYFAHSSDITDSEWREALVGHVIRTPRQTFNKFLDYLIKNRREIDFTHNSHYITHISYMLIRGRHNKVTYDYFHYGPHTLSNMICEVIL